MTEAIILAAGRGSRLLDRTADRPKCLVEVLGRPILEWALEALGEAGIERVTIVAGYRAAMLAGRGDAMIENARWQTTNMVRSLMCATELLRTAPVLVAYSDILFHADLARRLIDARTPLAITYDARWRGLWDARFVDPASDAESFAEVEGRLVEIGAPVADLDRVHGQFMGLLRFEPLGWRRVEQMLGTLPANRVDRLDMTGLLSMLLAAGVEIGAVRIDGHWCEIDSESDLALATERAQAGGWLHDWRQSPW